MAKIIYLCLRNPGAMPDFPRRVEFLNRCLIPDNIIPNPPQVLKSKGIWVGVINPTFPLLIKDTSVCLGFPIDVPSDWWKPRSGDPDGTYALFRNDENLVELGTDMAGTRTIWYTLTDQFFIASTSQRAIVSFLGDFQPNRNAFPWFLACGVLGPGYSWDTRIRPVEPDAHLVLDRNSWQLTSTQRDITFNFKNCNFSEHKNRLRNALDEVFDQIKFDPQKWLLTLSGGKDSRAILLLLKKRQDVNCITWGKKASLNNPQGDSIIARQLADRLKVRSEFYELDQPVNESGATILQRFLIAGEGRIDAISGYLDGLQIWKVLFERGIWGIIRGDEMLGMEAVYHNKHHVLTNFNIHLLSDYANLKNYRDFGLPEETIPQQYLQRPSESLIAWQYRNYRNFQFPSEMAALNEIKACYCEVMNPLISRRVSEVIKTVPGRLLDDKKLFESIINDLCPGIAFAKDSSLVSPENIIRQPKFLEPIIDELNSKAIERYLSKNLTGFVLKHIYPGSKSNHISLVGTIKKKLKRQFPATVYLTKFFPQKATMDYATMALRIYIISKMCQMLDEDTKVFRSPV